jgi:hypothetical protein
MPRRSLLPTLALATFAIVAIPAGAAINSSVSIKYVTGTPELMKGKVNSPKAGCEKRRTVKLLYLPDKGPKFAVASDKTNADGRWRIASTEIPKGGNFFYGGDYQAKAVKKELAGGKVCKPAFSKVVKVVL